MLLLTWIVEIWSLVLHDVGHLLQEDPVFSFDFSVTTYMSMENY